MGPGGVSVGGGGELIRVPPPPPAILSVQLPQANAAAREPLQIVGWRREMVGLARYTYIV